MNSPSLSHTHPTSLYTQFLSGILSMNSKNANESLNEHRSHRGELLNSWCEPLFEKALHVNTAIYDSLRNTEVLLGSESKQKIEPQTFSQ